MTWLERLAALLIRAHGRDYSASYAEDMLATLREREQDARRRGIVARMAFTCHESAALVRSAVSQRFRPDWERPVPSASGRLGMSAGQIIRELRHASRRLWRAPAFTAATVITLALAIGAITTVFTMVSRIVLAPLPYPSADRIVALDHAAPGIGLSGDMGMSIGLFREYRSLPSIEAIALYTEREGTLSGDGDATRVQFLQATPSIGELCGFQTQLGRWFVESEGEAGAPRVAVITDAMWRQGFGGSPSAVGRLLRVDGAAYEIVGVLRPAQAFPDRQMRFVIPLPLPKVWTRGVGFNYAGIARLAPGISVDAARRQQDAVIGDLPARYPADTELKTIGGSGMRSLAQPLRDSMVADTGATLWTLLGASVIVLLVTWTNLANLFLVRHESQRSQIALQRALGAGSVDVALHVIGETVLTAVAGGGLGLWLSDSALSWIVLRGPDTLPRLHELRLDLTSVVFTIGVTAATAAALAVIPLVRSWTRHAPPRLDSTRSAKASASQVRTRQVLISVQVGLAVMLLTAAALTTASFRNLLQVDPGFQFESRLVFDANLPRGEYRSRPDAALFHATVLDRLQSIPGVTRVAVTSTLPLEGEGLGDPLEVRGRVGQSAATLPVARFRRVSNEYFDTLGIPLRSGRGFDASDREGRTDAVIIDDALRLLYFGDRDPLGQQVRPIEGDPMNRWLTIVGVVGNTATADLSEITPVPKMYVPLRGSMWADVPAPHDVTYVLEVAGEPVSYIDAARRVLADLNPRVALARPERLTDAVARARASRALTMILLLFAAAVAVAIGSVGVYAVISYIVTQRVVEIGVRLAVGATPRQISAMIVRQGAWVIGAGVAIGMVASFASARLLRSLLFGIAPGDVTTHVGVAVAMMLIAIFACWLPAWRAAQVSPVRALKGD
jgi:putative ABC transport system permease protein